MCVHSHAHNNDLKMNIHKISIRQHVTYDNRHSHFHHLCQATANHFDNLACKMWFRQSLDPTEDVMCLSLSLFLCLAVCVRKMFPLQTQCERAELPSNIRINHYRSLFFLFDLQQIETTD